jgi:hypothetical protein
MKRDTNLDVWGDYSRDLLRVVDSLCTWPLVDEHHQNWIQSSSKTPSSSSSLDSTQSNTNVTNEITCDNSSISSSNKLKSERENIHPISRIENDVGDDDASSVASDCVPWGMTDEDALDEIEFTRELMGYEEGFDDYNYYRLQRILKKAEEEAQEEEREEAKANNRDIIDTTKNNQLGQRPPVVSSSRIKFRRYNQHDMKKNVLNTNQQAAAAARPGSPLPRLPLICRRISIPKKYPNFLSSPASPRRDTSNPPPSSSTPPSASPILQQAPIVIPKENAAMMSATTRKVDVNHELPSFFVAIPSSPPPSHMSAALAPTSPSPDVECSILYSPKPPPVSTSSTQRHSSTLLQKESEVISSSKETGDIVACGSSPDPNPLVRMTRSLNGVSSGIQLVYDIVPISSSLSPSQEKQVVQSFSIPTNPSSLSQFAPPLSDMTHGHPRHHRRTRSGGSVTALAASISHNLPLRPGRHVVPSNTITCNNGKNTTHTTTIHSKPPTWRVAGHHRRTRSNGELILLDSDNTKSKDVAVHVDAAIDSHANMDIDAHRFKWFPHFNHKTS